MQKEIQEEYKKLSIEGEKTSEHIIKITKGGASDKKYEINIGNKSKVKLCVFSEVDTPSTINYIISIGSESKLELTYIDFSKADTMVKQKIILKGDKSNVIVNALIIPEENSKIAHLQEISHIGNDSNSFVNYLSFLIKENSSILWNGLIDIEQSSQRISTYETSKNFILNKNSKAVAIPNLQIDTNNVKKVAHATSTGKLDEASIFYMATRGIKRTDAIKILLYAYSETIFRSIFNDSLKEEVLLVFKSYMQEEKLLRNSL